MEGRNMATKISDRELEEMYDKGTFRLTQERNDFLLPQILDFVREKQWMNLHPEYQRRLVWDNKKRSRFIESVFMNLAVPPVFLFEWDYNRYEVMDGQQRLSSISDFYADRFKLTGLEKWSALNGRKYSELPQKIQRGLDRRRVSAVVLLAENLSQEEKKYDIRRMMFERLNTGGQNLKAQELRNCIYASPFNDMVLRIASNPTFNAVWDIPRYDKNIKSGQISAKLSANGLFKRMTDCEIIVRFFAFRKKSKIKGSVKTMLDHTMRDHMTISEHEASLLEAQYLDRLKTAIDIFGDQTFKLPNAKGKSMHSQPLYDAVMISIDRLYPERKKLLSKKTQIGAKLHKELENNKFHELITAKANTAASIRQRLDRVEELFRDSIA